MRQRRRVQLRCQLQGTTTAVPNSPPSSPDPTHLCADHIPCGELHMSRTCSRAACCVAVLGSPHHIHRDAHTYPTRPYFCLSIMRHLTQCTLPYRCTRSLLTPHFLSAPLALTLLPPLAVRQLPQQAPGPPPVLRPCRRRRHHRVHLHQEELNPCPSRPAPQTATRADVQEDGARDLVHGADVQCPPDLI